MRLGKLDYKHDDRTLMMANFMAPPPMAYPDSFDWDRHRSPLPTDDAWGNFKWGDCVLAARANDLVRKERFETRRTIKLSEQMVVDKYRELTGSQSPGDKNDVGLVMLDTFNDWRNGWELALYGGRNYKIDAFGELDYSDTEELRAAIFLLGGMHFGLALPVSASDQLSSGVWDVVDGPDGEWGSWGGHAVFAKRYDTGGIYVITWDQEVYMTNAFIAKYADEAWTAVDALETHSRWLDVDKLREYLRDIGATVH